MNDTKAGWLQHPAAASLWVFGRRLRSGERLGHHRGPGDGSAERAHRYGRGGNGARCGGMGCQGVAILWIERTGETKAGGKKATWNQSSPPQKNKHIVCITIFHKMFFFSPLPLTVESAAMPSPGRRGQPLSARSLTAASRDLRAAVLLPPDTEREALHAVHAVGSSWFSWWSYGDLYGNQWDLMVIQWDFGDVLVIQRNSTRMGMVSGDLPSGNHTLTWLAGKCTI